MVLTFIRYKTFLTFLATIIFTFSLVQIASGVAGTEGSDCTAELPCETGLTCTDSKCVASGSTNDTFGLTPVSTGLKGTLGDTDLRQTVGSLINVALSLLGVVAVVIILIGGFKWMTAGGNDDQVGEARKWIFSGIIGLAIILSAWAIAIFVLDRLSTATGSGELGTFELTT